MAQALETLRALRHGQAEIELNEALTEAVQRARDTGKNATVSISITIKPKGASGQYFLTDDIKCKLPVFPKEPTILFGTPEGNLLRDDPHQQKLPLRELHDDAPANVKSINNTPTKVKQVS